MHQLDDAFFLAFSNRRSHLKLEVSNPRRRLLDLVEQASFTPVELPPGLRVELQSMLKEQDHWSRLLASSALLMLGAERLSCVE